jgi:hypothetical protein
MIKLENVTTKRYYYLVAYRDLFDDNLLDIFRGGNNRNVRVSLHFDSADARKSEIKRLIQRRIQRGYTLVD